ncbi:glycosyltransferase family 2 protein [Porphyromonas circumdentaria]|uniref:glycosyltransferase family 2 protein n=1 Tax=Porphyromonas circumdentaria TaxID=29524 RepID=UPI0026DC0DB3|nr:glycosyltransferase family 2 protein [Porphyromonas circumdentaria]MDO4721991.1 glycosyltransferase family 2 protein [Porphyromonas circumdentaria]
MTKISIITICYNAASTIVSTLQSVAEQTYGEIEYIVIDGASKDQTLQLVEQYTPYAHITSEPDRGLYDAMNKGIRQASGDYLWFLNAGDTLLSSTTVEEVVRTIEKHSSPCPPDIVYGDTMIVNSQREAISLRRLRPPKTLQKEDFLKGMLVCHQAFIVSRRIVLPYNLKYRLSSDFDWCIKMVERSEYNLPLNKVIVNYLEGGLSRKHHLRSLMERFHIMRKEFGLPKTLLAHLSFIFVRKR